MVILIKFNFYLRRFLTSSDLYSRLAPFRDTLRAVRIKERIFSLTDHPSVNAIIAFLNKILICFCFRWQQLIFKLPFNGCVNG